MVAALNGKSKSMDTLLDYFQRRRELRRKGWIDIRDDDGRTCLMMACAMGNEELVESLLDKGAKSDLKDNEGLTARGHAEKRKKNNIIELLDAWFAESEEEVDEDGKVFTDGLTSTQRSKLKKRQLEMFERRGQQVKEEEENVSEEDEAIGPPPQWPEIQKLVEAEKLLRPIHELNVVRTETNAEVDPALWYQKGINRLDLKMGQALRSIEGIGRMRNLQTLILNGNGLTCLPDEIGRLKSIKVLEVNNNALEALPFAIRNLTSLETLDLSNNKLSDLNALFDLQNIALLNVSNNELDTLDLDFKNLGRLHDLIISHNQISEIPTDIGLLGGLMVFNAENNQISELPLEMTNLKKITQLKMDYNPISDPKVARFLKEDQRKDLWKYLIKVGTKKGKGGKKKAATKSEESPPPPPSNYESDDSFDITMEEL